LRRPPVRREIEHFVPALATEIEMAAARTTRTNIASNLCELRIHKAKEITRRCSRTSFITEKRHGDCNHSRYNIFC